MLLSPAIIGPPLYGFYRALCSTLRITEVGRERLDALAALPSPVMVCFWHAEFFPLIYVRRQLQCIAIASASRDGDFLSGVLSRMGLEVARGSSSRGGFKAVLHVAKRLRHDNLTACIAVDGPRGPVHDVKLGALFIAARTGAPIVPTRMFMEKAFYFKSWDRFQVPYPFSRVRIVFGEPFTLPKDCDEAVLTEAAKQLKGSLDTLESEWRFD